MLTLGYIKHFAAANAGFAYLLIVLGILLEGEIVVIIAGIFSHLGSLNLYYVIIFILIGGVIKSFIGYNFGSYLQKHHSHRRFLCQAESRVNYFLPNYKERPFISIFLSRFLILSMHLFSIIFAGYKKVKVSTFIKAEMSSLFVWSMTMLSIGYFFSYTALSISKDIRNFLGIMLIFFLMFFVLEKIITFAVELFGTQKNEHSHSHNHEK
jgi:membrane protein DedA with SNARE-associated domain